MSASKATAKALLRGLAHVSTLLNAFEDRMTIPVIDRYEYTRLVRVRRALKHDCYQYAEGLPGVQEGIFLMHVQAALIGDLHGEYAVQPHEVGSQHDPSTWQVGSWTTPHQEGQ